MSQRLSLDTTPERSRLMSKVRQTGTSPELTVQALLRSMGYRFSAKAKDLPGTPDIVNRARRWAIFVHGCYWHAHDCHLWKVPKANSAFWEKKFEDNQARDKAKLASLKRKGYKVLTLWQCELRNEKKTKAKVLRFLTKTKPNHEASSRVIQVSDVTSRPQTPPEKYEYNEGAGYVSRTILRSDSTSFATRLDIPKGVSRKQDPRAMFDQVFLRSTKQAWHGPLRGSVRTADLFSGCGGLSLGAREASIALGRQFAPVLAIDHDASSLEVYKKNFNPMVAFKGDIWSVLTGEAGSRMQPKEKVLVKKLGGIDILLAGPPCQGHSDLNNHTRRKDKRNKLYERIARFAEVAGPTHIIVENVPTVVHGHDRTLDNTIDQLIRFGYKVDTAVVNLANLGVPQRRKRHVLIASNRSLSIDEIVDRHQVPKERTVRWAIADLARESSSELFRSPSLLHGDNVRRINYLMRTGKYDLPNRLRPICHQDEHSYVSMYGRLRYDEPAQTLTSGFGSPGQGRYIHPTRSRTLLPHEAARLQFFPDSFDFSSVKLRTSLANMIANAVPMILSFVCLLQLLG